MLGGPRHRVVDRLDKGIKRKAQDEEQHDISEGGSIAGWLRKRREAVDKAVSLDCSHLDFDAAELENTLKGQRVIRQRRAFRRTRKRSSSWKRFSMELWLRKTLVMTFRKKWRNTKPKTKSWTRSMLPNKSELQRLPIGRTYDKEVV